MGENRVKTAVRKATSIGPKRVSKWLPFHRLAEDIQHGADMSKARREAHRSGDTKRAARLDAITEKRSMSGRRR